MSEASDSIAVLHVDDDADFAELVATFLEREDDRFDVVTATSPSDGLDYLDGSRVDCIVSDYDLPGQNGLEFLDAVREDREDLPFVLFTGKGSEQVASDAIARGATDYLQKQPGTDQYRLLANRVRNAVEQYRSERRAAEHERVNTVVSEVTQALVRASSRAEIETRVCEILGDADPYRFAWLGEVDGQTGAVTSRARTEFPVDQLTFAVDGGADGADPVGRAVATHRLQTVQDTAELAPDAWREFVREHDVASLAVVPLVYDDTRYGVLCVCAERPYAFDGAERDLLRELGDDIAHALHARDVQADLRATTARLEALFEGSPDMIAAHDADGRMLTANRRLCEALGYSEDEIRGKSVWDLDPTVTPSEARAFWDGLSAGDLRKFEGKYRRRDGSTFPVEIHLVRREMGGEARFLSISHDITERKARERELRRNERRFEAVFDDPNILVGLLDPDGTVLDINQTAMEYIDTDLEAVTGEPFWETPWWGSDDAIRADVERWVERAAAGEYVEFQVDLVRPDDRQYTIDGVFRPVTNDEGEVVSIVVSDRDVTERMKRERAIEALHEVTLEFTRAKTTAEVADTAVAALRDVLDMPVSAVWLHDEREDVLRPVAWTDCATEIIGEIPSFDPGESLAWRAFETGESAVFDDVSTHPDRYNAETAARSEMLLPLGEYGVLAAGAPEPGAFDEVDVSLADILATNTEAALARAEREQTVRDHEAELRQQNERLEEFASIVSHDLRNPLNVAQGHLEFAREERDSDHLDAVATAHDRMAALIDDLLTLARRTDAGTELESVELAALVERCWQTVDTASATLVAETDAVVRADRSRVQQLLENLVRNAVEHGGEDVTVTVGDLTGGFYVEDDGPGIPEAQRERVFELGHSTSDGGTGFGLNIVSQIAEAHGWDVSVTAGPDGGARFEFTGVEFA